MQIKWSVNSKSSPIHFFARPRLCIVSSVENDFEETIKKVSALSKGSISSINSLVSGPVKKI